MRLLPILMAILVSVFLYFLIIDRDTLLALARGGAADAPASDAAAKPDPDPQPDQPVVDATIGVVAMHSQARVIDSAVILRGETEAMRQVSVRAETSGLVISDPLRKGAFVEAGDLLCRLDPGTRDASLAEARARKAEAEARIPEAEAQTPRAEAQLETARAQRDSTRAQLDTARAQVDTAKAQLDNAGAQQTTAEARLAEAEINFNAAKKLFAGGYASETRVANAEAAMRAAEGGVTQAKAGVAQAIAGVTQAKSGVTSAEAAVTQAQASVKSAQAGLKTAQAGILNSKAGVQSASAAVAGAEKEISRLEIHAPFAGLLESDTAELGSLLQPGAVCATVIQLDPIKLVGFVPETEIDRVAVGSMGGGRLSSGDELVGRVSFLSRSADPLTRTFRVEIEVPNSALAIRDGQTVEMAIASDGEPAHLVPQSTLTLNNEGTLGVRIVADDSTARFVPVTLLRDTAQGVWIAGLPDKADVIVIGQEYVIDGVPVRAAYKEPEQ